MKAGLLRCLLALGGLLLCTTAAATEGYAVPATPPPDEDGSQLWLKSDTYAKGRGSTVARVVDGSLHGHTRSAISGVANIGSDANWTGSHFNQANGYAFGRMAWDPDASARDVADEWVRQTFGNDPAVVGPLTTMMMGSRQTLVNWCQ